MLLNVHTLATTTVSSTEQRAGNPGCRSSLPQRVQSYQLRFVQ